MVAFARFPLQSKPLVYAMSAARFEASRSVRLGHMPATEYEDIAQDILVAIVQKWPAYKSSRGAAATFISIVAKRSAYTLSRARVAAKRGGGRRSISLSDCPIKTAEYASSRTEAQIDARSDVQSVVATLPSRLRQVCSLLSEFPPTEAARRMRVSQATFRKLVSTVRTQFEAAGLGPNR